MEIYSDVYLHSVCKIDMQIQKMSSRRCHIGRDAYGWRKRNK